MGKLKNIPYKSLQYLNEQPETTTARIDLKNSKDVHQVFLQQSVTLLAFKDKTINNGTVAPDVLHPKLFFGVVPEDIPLFIGAVIGASLIIALFLVVLTFWKCCCRMTVLSKKKEYWLDPKDASSIKSKHKIPVVQSNSVVFLGLKPRQAFDYKREMSAEDCNVTNPFSVSVNQDLRKRSFIDSQNMSAQCPEIIVSEVENAVTKEPASLPKCTCTESIENKPCSIISVPPISSTAPTSHFPNSGSLLPNDASIPNIVIYQDSPASFHRSFYSGTFDQHSLYSCESRLSSQFDLKTCRLTWSNYSLRPSSTSDCYFDLFQKANFCKKRKNRMRSDIAAAIALNRSQSSQLNKDTESLVENEVEVILDERTTL